MVLLTSRARMASASPGVWKWTMYMSSPKVVRNMAIGSIDRRGMKGVLSPITPAVRPGWKRGICQATMPPQSCPTQIALS